MSSRLIRAAQSCLPGHHKLRSEDCCLILDDGAAIVDGVTASDCASGGLLAKIALLDLERAWSCRPDLTTLVTSMDRAVVTIEDLAGIRRGGAAACVARWGSGRLIEIANVGDTNVAIVGRTETAFAFSPMRDINGRLVNYLGSNRCSFENVERYNHMVADGIVFIVILSDGVWEYLPLSFIRDTCLQSKGNLPGAAAELTAEARKRGSKDDASAVVAMIG